MDSVLRDIDREQSKMQTDIANLNRHYEKLQGYVSQHVQQSTIEWARLVTDHPKALLLIVETTRVVDEHDYSYGGESEPIRFTALPLASSGEVWDLLLHPTYSRAILGAEYHGLTMVDLEDRPLLADAWPNIQETLEDHHIIIFSADFARSALQSVYQTHILDSAYCLHNKCKEYYNQLGQSLKRRKYGDSKINQWAHC